MSLDYRPQTTSAALYAEIFDLERSQTYPAVDAFEHRKGYAIDRVRLEAAARVLSCPFKAAAPNWQHGRVIYAAIAKAVGDAVWTPGMWVHVDIGTAKGFSALCARWAIDQFGVPAAVHSVDVLPQRERVRRNTCAEVDGLKTLAEVLAPWPEAVGMIAFHESTGIDFLRRSGERIHSAFVDGKHSAEAVGAEWRELAKRQEHGDIAIFDDVQMEPVSRGLKGADAVYTFERLSLGTVNRTYAIGVRK